MPNCAICKSAYFARVEELEAHIAGDHFQCRPYECEKCRFAKFPTEYAIREHYEKDHNVTDYHVRYHISPDTLTKQREVRKAMLLMSPSDSCYKDSTAPHVLSTAPHVLSTDAAKESHLSAEGSTDATNNAAIETATAALVESIIGQMPVNTKIADNVVMITSGTAPSSECDISDAGILCGIVDVPPYGVQAIINDKWKKKVKVRCRKCHTSVARWSQSYLNHTNVHHLKLPLFRCLACNKNFPGLPKIQILRHVNCFHNGDMSLIEDNKKKYMPQIRDASTHNFDYKPNMTQ